MISRLLHVLYGYVLILKTDRGIFLITIITSNSNTILKHRFQIKKIKFVKLTRDNIIYKYNFFNF